VPCPKFLKAGQGQYSLPEGCGSSGRLSLHPINPCFAGPFLMWCFLLPIYLAQLRSPTTLFSFDRDLDAVAFNLSFRAFLFHMLILFFFPVENGLCSPTYGRVHFSCNGRLRFQVSPHDSPHSDSLSLNMELFSKSRAAPPLIIEVKFRSVPRPPFPFRLPQQHPTTPISPPPPRIV